MNQTFTKSMFVGLLMIALMIQPSCTPSDLSKENLIPKPVSVVSSGSSFELSEQTVIYVAPEASQLIPIGQFLADQLNPSTGLDLEVKTTSETPVSGNIYLQLAEDDELLGDEGYELNISNKLIVVKANKPAGLFYAVQTIRQLLPSNVELKTKQSESWKIPTGIIRDYPRYSYRGCMLDVARHFFTVTEVKELIDRLAYYKMNVLHLHLTDDQGWRIEIKSWPNLTAHGATTEVGGGDGGFYTQEHYSDLVNYAQQRFITIVPEIDMPGHTNAALSSYPELNCDNKAPELYTGIEVGFSSLCIEKDITYQFVDDVIRELVALTPGEYIHIGGDESHATKTEDYIRFMNRIQEMVNARGKKVLAWDEIALATLKPNTIVQYWAKTENAVAGIAKGAKVLMSPSKFAYLDMQYDSTSIYGLHWAAYIEVDRGYNWDPAKLVPEIKEENIIGIEAPLWSETVSNLKEAEYLIFPRLLGYAEIGWTPSELRNWEDYKVRLAHHGERMKAMNISYFPSKVVDWNAKNMN